MNLPDSMQYKSHSAHSLFEAMHGYILSITFGNAIALNSMGFVIEYKNFNRIKSAIETLFLCFIDFYWTPIIIKQNSNTPIECCCFIIFVLLFSKNYFSLFSDAFDTFEDLLDLE